MEFNKTRCSSSSVVGGPGNFIGLRGVMIRDVDMLEILGCRV